MHIHILCVYDTYMCIYIYSIYIYIHDHRYIGLSKALKAFAFVDMRGIHWGYFWDLFGRFGEVWGEFGGSLEVCGGAMLGSCFGEFWTLLGGEIK